MKKESEEEWSQNSVNGTSLSKILKNDKIKIPKIKPIKDDRHFWVKSSIVPFSNKITMTSRARKILNSNEMNAMILHEVYHLHSRAILYYALVLSFFTILFAVCTYFLNFWYASLVNLLIFRFLLWHPISIISQNEEFSADEFSARRIDSNHLIRALEKTKLENPPLYLVFVYRIAMWPYITHPRDQDRIKRLRSL